MSELPNMGENNREILDNIQSLQNIEKDLFKSLETNTSLSVSEKQKIIEKINKISDMRLDLYKTLGGMNNYLQHTLKLSRDTLGQQKRTIQIVENELNKSKSKLSELEAEKNNKIRLVQINSYYSDRYAEHTKLLRQFIYTIIPLGVILFFYNRGIMPTSIFYILTVIVSFIGASYLLRTWLSIINRDNMNYQEYNWFFTPDLVKLQSTEDSKTRSYPWVTAKLPGTCIGEYCCSDNTSYDENINQCIVKD
jgi:hypothetical protein